MKNLLLAAGLAGLMELASALVLIKIVGKKLNKLEKQISDGDSETLCHVNEAFKIHERTCHQRKDA